jgi:hypothetical protein
VHVPGGYTIGTSSQLASITIIAARQVRLWSDQAEIAGSAASNDFLMTFHVASHQTGAPFASPETGKRRPLPDASRPRNAELLQRRCLVATCLNAWISVLTVRTVRTEQML